MRARPLETNLEITVRNQLCGYDRNPMITQARIYFLSFVHCRRLNKNRYMTSFPFRQRARGCVFLADLRHWSPADPPTLGQRSWSLVCLFFLIYDFLRRQPMLNWYAGLYHDDFSTVNYNKVCAVLMREGRWRRSSACSCYWVVHRLGCNLYFLGSLYRFYSLSILLG